MNSPFYEPGKGYGADQDWRTTPFVKKFIDPQMPEGVFYGHLTERGYGGMDAASQFAQNLYGQALTGYKSATRENPALDWRTYLRHHFKAPDLRTMWASATPSQQGIGDASFGRTRLIGWG